MSKAEKVEDIITVNLGQMAISDHPDTVIVAFGLGSCVGVAAYDPVCKIGGMLHALLPQSRNGDPNRAKYVDTGIVELLDRLLHMGARQERLIWRMAGGAQMLNAPGLTDRFQIGAQNVAMAQQTIARHRLRLIAQDTGGNLGRTMRLLVLDGQVTVRNVNGPERAL